jgi:hypothetical protein
MGTLSGDGEYVGMGYHTKKPGMVIPVIVTKEM